MSNKIEMMQLYQRHSFDPSNKDDMLRAKKYLNSNKWDGCPFYLEWPYLSIPDMIKDKITRYALS